MKKTLLILPALASCAPTVVQTPTYTAQRSYATTCAAALDEVARVAPSLRPASFAGLGGWQAYSVASRSANSLALTSSSTSYGTGPLGGMQQNTSNTTSMWSCTEGGGRATLTVSSTGQTERSTNAVHDAFFRALNLPQ